MRARASTPSRSALIVGHPGHELRLHHWLETTTPTVHVITDGSGSRGVSRLDSTRRVLDAAGAEVGAVFGRFTDREFYDRVLAGDVAAFRNLIDDLVDALAAGGVDVVVADAAEGFNPAHDICRYAADTVVARLGRAGRSISSFEFALEAAPDEPVTPGARAALRLDLDDAALDRKIAAARGYPELAAEVDGTIARFGTGAFAVERLFPAASGARTWKAPHDLPVYERHGRQRVADRLYPSVLTYADHVAPLRAALNSRAGRP